MLALDTSAAVAVALHDGTDVVGSALAHDPRRHAELLVPMVDTVLREAGATRRDVTAVAVGRGPGPFTGLRVGLVTARTLALALGVPVHGVCSLDALAQQAVDDAVVAGGATFVVATDARRREVYWGRYQSEDGVAVPVGEPQVALPADVPLDGDPVVGRGAAVHPDVLPAVADGPLDPDAGALASVVVRLLAAGADLSSTAPLYLRRPDATEPGAPKSVLGGPRA
ncbi:tRNA (adenosine(37)-N6)-threonylcarbamoyltransferase complex dimerization subunit type 1 TsaB [Angustibacter speluncae]